MLRVQREGSHREGLHEFASLRCTGGRARKKQSSVGTRRSGDLLPVSYLKAFVAPVQNNGISYAASRCGSRRHGLSRCPELVDPANPLPFASCFVCSGRGHLASTCPKNQSKGVYPNGGCCKLCKETSHLAKDCPLRKKGSCANPTVRKLGFLILVHRGRSDHRAPGDRAGGRRRRGRFPHVQTRQCRGRRGSKGGRTHKKALGCEGWRALWRSEGIWGGSTSGEKEKGGHILILPATLIGVCCCFTLCLV